MLLLNVLHTVGGDPGEDPEAEEEEALEHAVPHSQVDDGHCAEAKGEFVDN